ncbi:hypothetical protein, partial [Bosea sp. TND4EK4]|uniref:hypothetical protein n=1 Tax=Bosea sp. TND4EK4 TaxID=1907408 RepID=UPI001AED04E1
MLEDVPKISEAVNLSVVVPIFEEEESIPLLIDMLVGELDNVRRQNIRHNSRRRLAECGPRLGVDVRRRACG